MKSVLRGAVIIVFTRWVDRFIGFLSTLILARLLAPEDFGLVSLAWILIGLLGVLLDVGVSVNLIQRQATERDEYDSGFTIGVIQGTITSAVVFLSAPFAADYFRDPRVELLLYVLAPSMLIGSFTNVGIVDFQKNLEFNKEFWYFFTRRLCGFVGTVIAAYSLRSYWGLVIGTYVNTVAGVLLSYVLSPYRPRFCTRRIREMWTFSQWNLFRNIGVYVNTVIDRTILGRRTSASEVGLYQLSSDIAAMPTSELLAPVGRALFPALARYQRDIVRLRQDFLLALALAVSVALPAAIGLALVAREAVIVLLGPQWLPAVDLLRVLALANGVLALGHTPGYLMLATGRFRELTFVTWLQIGLFLVLAFAVFPHAGLIAIAYVRLAAVVLCVGLTVFLVTRFTPAIGFGDFFDAVWRPTLAVAVMAGAVSMTNPGGDNAAFILTARVLAGVVSYTLAIVGLWQLAGKPYGAERYLLDKALGVLSKWRYRAGT